MAIIILKGTDRKLECTLDQCNKVNKLKENRSDPKTALFISGTMVELGDVRYAIPDRDTDRQMVSDGNKIENNSFYEEENKKYSEKIKTLSVMSPEEKSKNTRHAKMIIQAYTREMTAPRVLIEEIEQRQLSYFKINPNHPFASPMCYKDLIPTFKDINKVNSGVAVKVNEICIPSLVSMVEKTIKESFNECRRQGIKI